MTNETDFAASNRSENRHVAVIGGGLSGLACAAQLRLKYPGIRVTVFEAGDRTGGVIHTERVEGFLVDHGADMFATKPDGALALIEKLGGLSQLIEPEISGRGARIVRRGKLIPIPDGFVLMRATKFWPMVTTPLLSIKGKLRFLAERYVGSPPSILDEDHDESVDSFVRRRMGDEVLNSIVAPLSAGIYTADITKLSMRATMGPIAEMERAHGSLARATAARRRSGQDNVERNSTGARYGNFRAFRGGMIQLIRLLSDSLPDEAIRLNAPVQSLVRNQDRWTITHSDGQADSFDHVVVAVPPTPASRLLTDICPAAASGLAAIEASSAAIIVLGVRTADIADNVDTFGFVVPATENRRILAGSFASHKFAGRAPDGHTLVRVFVGGAMQSELLDNNDKTMVKLVREELADLIGLSGEPIVTRVVRWNDAMPQYHVGHTTRVKQIEAAIATVPNLSLINNGLNGVGIAPVITAAGKVAL